MIFFMLNEIKYFKTLESNLTDHVTLGQALPATGAPVREK